VDQNTPDAARLRKYLLAELDPVEQARIEDMYFRDDEAFEQLGIAEDELIDAYVAGDLSPHERAAFDNRYLTTPTRRERVAFARAMHDVSRRRAADLVESDVSSAPLMTRLRQRFSTPAMRWAAAAAALVLVGTTVWLTIDRARLSGMVTSLERERLETASQVERLSTALEQERRRADTLEQRPKAFTPAIATLLLKPGATRSAGASNDVQLPPDAALLRLTLALEQNTHPRYRAVLTTADGDEVWAQHGLTARVTAQDVTLNVDLPASVLSNRDYIVTVSGVGGNRQIEELADYAFRVRGR
jgi:anti-sigma factor RsiW